RQVSGSRRFNRGSGVFAFLIPTCPRWTSDFDTNAHHRRLFTAAAWRGLEPAPGSGLRRAFLHLSCSLCTIGLFIANLPFLRLRRTLDAPAQAIVEGRVDGGYLRQGDDPRLGMAGLMHHRDVGADAFAGECDVGEQVLAAAETFRQRGLAVAREDQEILLEPQP